MTLCVLQNAGISPSQRKLLTIGLELVANPSILFVDEPTTGLDSKAAMTVRAVCAVHTQHPLLLCVARVGKRAVARAAMQHCTPCHT